MGGVSTKVLIDQLHSGGQFSRKEIGKTHVFVPYTPYCFLAETDGVTVQPTPEMRKAQRDVAALGLTSAATLLPASNRLVQPVDNNLHSIHVMPVLVLHSRSLQSAWMVIQ